MTRCIIKKRNPHARCEFLLKSVRIERVVPMPLNQQNQVELLKDILSNHQVDCCGSVSELEQLERLVQSLKDESNLNPNVLEQIHNYSQNGIQSNNLDQHIESHQQQLSQWVSNVDQFS